MKAFGKAAVSVGLAAALGMGVAVPANAAYQRTLSYSYMELQTCKNQLQTQIRQINQLPDAWVMGYKMCREVKSTRGKLYGYTITYGYGR